jgi:hypothetical protein
MGRLVLATRSAAHGRSASVRPELNAAKAAVLR